MFSIDSESIQRLADVYNLLNQLEIRGISNIGIVYKSMISIKEILEKIDENNNKIVINNTKEG